MTISARATALAHVDRGPTPNRLPGKRQKVSSSNEIELDCRMRLPTATRPRRRPPGESYFLRLKTLKSLVQKAPSDTHLTAKRLMLRRATARFCAFLVRFRFADRRFHGSTP